MERRRRRLYIGPPCALAGGQNTFLFTPPLEPGAPSHCPCRLPASRLRVFVRVLPSPTPLHSFIVPVPVLVHRFYVPRPCTCLSTLTQVHDVLDQALCPRPARPRGVLPGCACRFSEAKRARRAEAERKVRDPLRGLVVQWCAFLPAFHLSQLPFPLSTSSITHASFAVCT